MILRHWNCILELQIGATVLMGSTFWHSTSWRIDHYQAIQLCIGAPQCTQLVPFCNGLARPPIATFGTERSMCVLGFLDCWRVIYPSQTFTNERAVDMPGSTLQRECCGGSVSVSATPKTKWRSGKGGAVMKTKKAKGKAETETSVLFQVFAFQDLSNFVEVPFSVGKIVWFS